MMKNPLPLFLIVLVLSLLVFFAALFRGYKPVVIPLTASPASKATQAVSLIQGNLEWAQTLIASDSSDYKLILVTSTFNPVRATKDNYQASEYAYLVDRYPNPTKVKDLAALGVPGMVGLGREVVPVMDKYYLYNTGLDYLIFTSSGEIITDSIRKSNPEMELMMWPQEARYSENPIMLTIGGEGIGNAGSVKLDVTTGKIVKGSIKRAKLF